MKTRTILGFVALLTIIMVVSMHSSTVCASADVETSEMSASAMATGKGWFMFNGRRHNFAFAVSE